MQAAKQTGTGPQVHAKELQSIHLLREIVGWTRLDAWPFYALFAGVTLTGMYHASRFEWDSLLWTSRFLGLCVLLRVLLYLFTQWLISVRLFLAYSRCGSVEDSTSILVVPAKFVGVTEIVPLQRRTLRDGLNEVEETYFEFRKQLYVYNYDNNMFEKLKFPVQETFEAYLKTGGLGSDQKAIAAMDKYGENHFQVPLPAFTSMLKEQCLAPFFCFQVFCVGLWCLDQYWYYSMFTLFMLVTFECTVVGQRLRNLKELRSLQTPKQSINVYRNGRWSEVKGEGLLPGDVISIGRPIGVNAGDDERVVPADCLLLAGSCIVEEAVLTGESTPQWKAAVADADPKARLDISQDKHHVLFGGTKILQHTGEKVARIRTTDGGCLAVVLRTGFETSQGQLMRTILYSSERVTANNMETGIFILFLLCFAVSASLYVLINGLKDPDRNRFKLVLNCVMIVTSVIPPELPMELSIAVNASLVALARKRVFCTEPFRIPFGGKVEVCCFDKTGTLTSDHLLLEGILGSVPLPPLPGEGKKTKKAAAAGAPALAVTDGGGGAAAAAGTVAAEDGGAASKAVALVKGAGGGNELLKDMRRVSLPVARIMAACHSMVLIQDELVGDPLERACIEAIGWSFVSDVAQSQDKLCKATVLHRHHFSSNLKRMSVVARVEAPGPGGPFYEVMVKGAPEVVKQFLAVPPADYDRQYKAYAAKGARVIALARRRLGGEADLDAAQLRAMTRQDVESGLEFAGFAVFSCPLKPESEPALRELAESSHQLMMITGDAPLTACFAASQVYIVTRPVVILSHRAEEIGHTAGGVKAAPKRQEDAEYVWLGPDETLQIPFSRDWLDILEVASEYDLCLSGDALTFIEAIGLAAKVIPLTQVFARVSPEQKELVLVTLRAAGRTTLMCGDGTNDVGGLKAAHVGVALLSANENYEKLMNLRSADRKEKADAAAAALAALDAEQHNKESVVYKQAVVLANVTRAEAMGAVVPAAKGVKKKRQGEEMLDKLRASGQAVPARLAKMAKWMDDMEEGTAGAAGGDMPMLKPGDASMASPFTAKASSVAPCCDIIKQGRATLVTTVTMFKILGLLCLSTAYALSVMYLEGVKLSDVQATCTGMLSAAMFFFISSAKPSAKLNSVRPHPGIFNPYFFLSLLGQFATHLGLLMYMYRLALAEMPSDERQGTETDFKPNLVNSVCYIVEAVVQLSTFTCNYMGLPHNMSIVENRPMFNSIRFGSMFIAVVALDVVPGLGAAFGLVHIPPHIQRPLIIWSCVMVVFNFNWERWLRARFPAPVPPAKGYMSHLGDLERARARNKKLA